MKPVFKEYGLVLENMKLKEDLGIESLIFAKITVDITSLIAFRESVNDQGEPEPYTVIYLDNGQSFCIEVSYEDFLITFHTEVKFEDDEQ
jgi:hypothetical protein